MMRMEYLRRIVAIVGLASFVLLAPSDHAEVGTASELLADSLPSPALPVRAWDEEGQYVIGLLTPNHRGEAHFIPFLREKCVEPAREGFWIESWKIEALRRIMPATLAPFCFGNEISVEGVVYRRVELRDRPALVRRRDAFSLRSVRHDFDPNTPRLFSES